MKKVIIGLLLLILTTIMFAKTHNWSSINHVSKMENDLKYGSGIAFDDDGNSYILGCFTGTAHFGFQSLTSDKKFGSVYIAKLSANGKWLWAIKLNGKFRHKSYGLVIDDDGNCFIIGKFKKTATFGTISIKSRSGYDLFVAKINTKGEWLWAANADGSFKDESEVVIDDNGNSYVTGLFNDTASFGEISINSGGFYKTFLAKLDANGNWLWATRTE